LLWLCSIVSSWECDTSSVVVFAQYCLGYSWSFVFPNEVSGRFSILVMNVIGILMGSIPHFRKLLFVLNCTGEANRLDVLPQ
jgi:hypothetical protein